MTIAKQLRYLAKEHFGEREDTSMSSTLFDAADRIEKLEEAIKEKELCPNCGINPATSPHPCPFEEEVYNNSDTKCTCCTQCEHECAMDI